MKNSRSLKGALARCLAVCASVALMAAAVSCGNNNTNEEVSGEDGLAAFFNGNVQAVDSIKASLDEGQSLFADENNLYVVDQYGVVQRVNPQLNKVYLVFTAHFSTDDNGRFENFDGIVPVLDVLKEKGVKGSFFPTGNCFREEKYQEPIKRIIEEGHYLSAHSNHHLLLCAYENRDSTLVSADSIATDIAGMEAELNKFGLGKSQYCWMIPPYEYYNQETADALRNLGYSLVNPTRGIETGMDWMGKNHPEYMSAEEQIASIWAYEQEKTLNGCVVLVHAMVYPDREDADRIFTHLGEIIDRMRELGYEFGTFSELL